MDHLFFKTRNTDLRIVNMYLILLDINLCCSSNRTPPTVSPEHCQLINLHKIASKLFLKYRKRRITTKYKYTLERKHTVVTTELKEKDV